VGLPGSRMTDDSKLTRAWPALLAAIGGAVILAGGILGSFLIFSQNTYYGSNLTPLSLLALAILAIIFGVVILILSGYTTYQGHSQDWIGAVSFLILGTLALVFAGGGLLVAVGAILTIIAGLVLLIMLLLHVPDTSKPSPL